MTEKYDPEKPFLVQPLEYDRWIWRYGDDIDEGDGEHLLRCLTLLLMGQHIHEEETNRRWLVEEREAAIGSGFHRLAALMKVLQHEYRGAARLDWDDLEMVDVDELLTENEDTPREFERLLESRKPKPAEQQVPSRWDDEIPF